MGQLEHAMDGETMVSLRLFGDDLEPDEVSRLLGAEPAVGRRKGEARVLKTGKRVVAKTGLWSIEGRPESQGDLEGQLAKLLARLTPNLSVWGQLSRRYHCRLDCFVSMGKSNEYAELGPKSLAMLAERGVSLSFDIYAPLDERHTADVSDNTINPEAND